MNQTKRVLNDYKQIKFFRVVPSNAFKPHDLEFNENFKHMDIDEFLRLHNIQRQL